MDSPETKPFIDFFLILPVAPIFMKRSQEFLGLGEDSIALDTFDYAHKCIAEAMTSMIFGSVGAA